MKKLILAAALLFPLSAYAQDCAFPKELSFDAVSDHCAAHLRSLYANSKDFGQFTEEPNGESGRAYFANGRRTGVILSFKKTSVYSHSASADNLGLTPVFDYGIAFAAKPAAFDNCSYISSPAQSSGFTGIICGSGDKPKVAFELKGRVVRGQYLKISGGGLKASVRQYAGFLIMEGTLNGERFYAYFWL